MNHKHLISLSIVSIALSASMTAFAGMDHRGDYTERVKYDEMYLESEIQFLQDQVKAKQDKKSCIGSAHSFDDFNICSSKEQAAVAEARVHEAERRKNIDQERRH